jgi:diacylglycerol kinase (ATP)
MRVALVVNPASGQRKGQHIAQRAAHELGGLGHQIDVITGSDANEARASLDELASRERLHVVGVVGGDGALHGLLPTLVKHDVTTAMVPAGTGNDVARHLGVRKPDDAIRAIHTHTTKRIDLIETDDGKLVATVVASGFDSKVNERANSMTWPKGNLRYNLAIVKELREFEPLVFTLEVDGQTYAREAMLVAVGNLPSFGGGLRIAEGARDADGLLDVIVIHPVSKVKLLRVFPMLYRGTHTQLPEFERMRAKQVTWHSAGIVAYGDGERLGPLPLTAVVRPNALRVVTA